MTHLLLIAVLLAPIASAQEMPPEPAPLSELVGIDGVTPAGPAPADTHAVTIDIAEELRCPVCQGLSVADSQTETAVAMYDRIHELVRLGYSEEQIDQYFIDRYGEWVLLAPRSQGMGILLWWIPVGLVLAIGGVMVWLTRSSKTPAAEPTPPATTSQDPYLARVLADLDDDGRQ